MRQFARKTDAIFNFFFKYWQIFKKSCIFGVETQVMNYRAAKTFILNKLKAELPPGLSYHGLHHTKDVLRVAASLCVREGIKGKALILVKTAAVLHDAGFVFNQHSGHELQGCRLAREILPRFDYTTDEIEQICNMIMATKIPQSPDTLEARILCDADLDYLGRTDFYPIGRTLFEEMTAYRLIGDEEAWNRLQINFLGNHRFHTQTNQQLREPVKQTYLEELKQLVAQYDI